MSLPDGGPAHARLATRPSTLTAADVAWIALIPCALIGVAAIVLLGPPLGHALFSHSSDSLWPPDWWETTGRPEPTKHGRVIVAALMPAVLVFAIVVGARRRIALGARTVRVLSFVSYALVLTVVAVALAEQHPTFTGPEEPVQVTVAAVFGVWKLLLAAALVAIAVAVLRHGTVAARIAELARETRTRRWVAFGIAVALVATWVLKAVTSNRLAVGVVALNLPWTLNDSIAVLDGRTPLVDYHPIYARLLPYLCAPVLSVFGANATVYSVFMALLDGLALVAVYAIFRRVTRTSLLACALFVPFLATSDVSVPITAGVDAGLDTSPLMLTGLWPMRYGGAYLLAWLTARHLGGTRPRRTWLLFLAGGLIAIDGLEFGVGAVGATLVALLCARPPSSARDVLRLLANAAAGMLAAVAAVALITLARSGELPDFTLLLEWPRIFTNLGWFSMPLPTWDLHVVIYVTFVAAAAVAAVRVARREEDVLLTGMLAWSGAFGLLAGGYIAGRPDAIKITGALSAWSFALSMLAIVCIRGLAARSWRPTVPHLLVLFGLALSVCSIGGFPLPNQQLERLRGSGPAPDYLPAAQQFIGERTRRGEKVMVLIPMSYAITHQLGLRNVAPYGFMNAIVSKSQMSRLLHAMRHEQVRTAFIPAPGSYLLNEGDSAWPQLRLLEAIGFPQVASAARIIELRRS